LTLHSTPPTTPAPPSSPTRRSSDLLKAHELKRGRETRIATNRGRGICFRTDPPGFLLVNIHSQIEWLRPAQQNHRRGASSGNGEFSGTDLHLQDLARDRRSHYTALQFGLDHGDLRPGG